MKNRGILFLLFMVLLSIAAYRGCYWFETWNDHRNYPWAYSTDSAQRLVGKWHGTFTDPEGVAHQLQLNIADPVSEEEREERVTSHRRRRMRHRSYKLFDGTANVLTQTQTDSMTIDGSLTDTAPPTKLEMRLQPAIEDHHIVGFELNQLTGDWKDGQLHMTAHFVYFRADGSSHYDSSQPKHNYTHDFVLQKK